MKKENRGGAREGAGRKPKGVKCCSFYLTEEAQEILATKEKKSEFINELIINSK
jgi:hypothetical protein